jgi:hypothetical protein
MELEVSKGGARLEDHVGNYPRSSTIDATTTPISSTPKYEYGGR